MVYRYHLESPVNFTRSVRVTIEGGHANHRSDNYFTVAYWYQAEPHEPFAALPPAGDRRARTPWTNPLQWLVCATLAGALAALGVLVFAWLR